MSLTTCIRKAGKNLNAEDKNAILEAARVNRKAGMSADDAAKAAVRARLEAVQAELAAEQSQVSTWTPDQPKTLKERAEEMAATKPQRSLQEQVERPAEPDAVVASVGDPEAKGERKFYVTMVRGDRVARLAGPFDTKEEAEAMKPRAQDEANKADPRSAFDAFGVSAITSEEHKPGTLNERLGLSAPAAPERAGFDEFFKTVETSTDDAGNVALFSRTGNFSADGFVSPPALRAEVSRITSNWDQDLADVQVVNRVEDLPSDIQQAVRNVGSENTVRGLAMPDGRVCLVAENISTIEEGRFVLFHEVAGHIGLRAFLGDGYDLQMRTLKQANPALAKEADAWFARYGEDEIAARVKAGFAPLKARQMVNALAVEEALADRAGDAPELKGWKRLMAALQRGLRRLGLGSVADMLEGMTEAETLDLLVQARRTVQRGQVDRGLNIGRMPAYQRVWHGTPYRGIEQFSTDKIGTGEGAQAYGWGLYFAGRKEIAEHYRKVLTSNPDLPAAENTRKALRDALEAVDFLGFDSWQEAARTIRQEGFVNYDATPAEQARITKALREFDDARKGQLYEVDIPEDSEMLLWDKPLSEQPAKVREALKNASPATTLKAVLDGKTIPELLSWVKSFDRNSSFDEMVDEDPSLTADDLRASIESSYDPEEMAAYLGSSGFDAGRTGESMYRELTSKIAGGPVVNAMTRAQLNDWYEREVGYRPDDDNGTPLPLQELRDMVAGFNEEIVKTGDAPRTASLYLKALGIRGIKYLDGTSRNAGDGTYNYVIFDGADAKIQGALFSRRQDFTPPPEVATGTTDQGLPEFAGRRVTIAFPQATERFEVIPGDGQEVVSYAIMPNDGFDVLGHVELLVENGRPVSLLDIEVYRDKGRNRGVGRAVIETLLAANPDADLNISNIVPEARGFWESMGVPQQNVEGAYDGTLNWQAYAANNRAAGRDTQGRGGARQGGAAEGTGSRQGAAGQGEVGPLFSRRTDIQARARELGLPALGTNESIARLVSIAESNPSTWTREDFDLIAPHLSVHQDLRADPEGRINTILSEGLTNGMVDNVGNMARGTWTWSRGLMGKPAYVFISGALKYQGGGNPRLAPGNKPLFAITPEKGQGFYEALQTARVAPGALPAFSRRTSQDILNTGALRDVIPPGVQEWITDRTTSQRGFNRIWHRTVGTQLHKAKTNKEFGRAYYAVQDYMKDVSRMATLAAELAPDMLPQIESLGDLARLAPTLASPAAYKQRKADIKAASDALFDGTLRYTRDEDGRAVKVDPESDELGGLVWTDAELKARGMSERAIKMYRQSRKAIGQSLDSMLAADLYRQVSVMDPELVASDSSDYNALMAGLRRAAASDTPGDAVQSLRDAIGDRLDAIQTSLDGQPNQHTPGLMQRRQELRKLQEMIGEKVQRIEDLKDAGYAPLMRFGPYAVDVVNPDGRRVFFGMYESQAAANQAARKFQGDGLIVTQSVMPQKQFEALQGVSPETALLFAEMLGVEKNEAMQVWLKNAVAEQSALKRHIRRKGIEGFDDDGGRVLAAFVTSNARAASRALHSQRISDAVESISQGDVQDEARALAEYVSNPKEEAQAIRSLLFVQYIGGSIASAIVNLTQTVVQTFPFLSQYGGGIKAGQRIGAAMKIAAGGAIADKDLAAAVARAEKDGIIKPQEVFQLQAEASRNLGSNLYARSLLAAWGSMFQLAEVFNRRMAFIAAYKTAKEQGIADPFAFAENAVDETQSVFNKGNRPNWARGAVGSTIFTFKTFTIQYVEFLKRLATAGEPGSPERARGQKAAALALLALMLLAGMKGLPFAEDAEDLIDTVAQALGYNWTTDAQIDKWMDDTLGEALSDILQHGLSGVPGVPFDVSQRLGMQNLLPGTGLLKQSETNKQNQVLEVFGVAGSAVRDATQGQFLPIAIRNLMIGLDTYETGLYRDRRGRAVTEADPLDAVLKAIGLQPNNVASAQRDIGRQIELRSLYQAVKEEITDSWAQAKFAGDTEGIENARASLKRWNDMNPEARIIILPRTIDQRVIQMRRSKAERTIANAPRPLRASTAEALE